MAAKEIPFSDDARDRRLVDVDVSGEVAKQTHGRKGLCGAHLVKEVASKISNMAGDRTITATLLVQAIIGEGLKSLVAGANPRDVQIEIDQAVLVVLEALKTPSKPGAISANCNESIGRIIAAALDKVGSGFMNQPLQRQRNQDPARDGASGHRATGTREAWR